MDSNLLPNDAIDSGNLWEKNIGETPEIPKYYSQRAILGFSLFFTVIFGAVLLAINLEDKKARWIVVLFGVLYTGLAIVVVNSLPANTLITFGINSLGGLVLVRFFWNKYLGKGVHFLPKPIWKPLIISLVIAIPFIAAIIYGSGG
jgi:hypothetical protein